MSDLTLNLVLLAVLIGLGVALGWIIGHPAGPTEGERFWHAHANYLALLLRREYERRDREAA